ncbi:hypothetical protein [uncultured Megasphaera sp.]|uniref:hypothetical protein n=1 Tax=uncultured Megasphaera sp. TaxID=165188 RepID=UPI0028683B59|nr:hypothetical protein [uncultured Megasphaera sp.]
MMNDMLKVAFTNQELSFLKKNGFNVNCNLNIDIADEIVDKLGYDDTGIAADIITKITTNKDW